MIVKSPLGKKEVKRNVRKRQPDRSDGHKARKKSQNGVNYGKKISDKEKKKRISLPQVKPWKVILGAIILGFLGALYINHVFATQKLLIEVQQLEHKYNKAKRKYDDNRLEYDRMIGPAEIHSKAKKLGFINGGPADRIIEVEPDE